MTSDVGDSHLPEMSGPSSRNIETSNTGCTTSTPCPLMFAGTNHRSTDVTGVGSVLTFLEECKAYGV